MSALLLTPLDYTAAGYWQDFLAERPIAGGIVYETELRDCVLDESLTSLQRVDTLLTQIRRDMIKAGQWHEETLLVDERYRNFMVFLAFYAGRVLAQQWQHTPHWYGQFELRKRYPNVPLTGDDFYQHMAVVYREAAEHSTLTNGSMSVFFALEPIGLRLFGHIDRPFEAVQGGQVASGLYQAVSARLQNASETPIVKATVSDAVYTIDTHKTAEPYLDTVPDLDTASALPQNPRQSSDSLSNKIETSPISANNALSTTDYQPSPDPSRAETLAVDTASDTLISSKPASVSKTPPTPEIFTQLLIELNEIEVVQSADNMAYQQACHVLDQFEEHIAKQNKPRAHVVFSQSHLKAKKQALLKLQAAANAGNTAAMLRLAMYELLGEGLAVDQSAGVATGAEWVKQAASKDDSRAQRLLSKMYYQGIGVAQDIKNGQYWLTQAAKNGHAEAADLVVHWQQAQDLISTQKREQHSVKRYQILLGAVAVVAMLILIIL
ncbi:tetratricopeptide repeat protein [Psychrobacter alimentarius]|uniref:tetratricopeptide repeat protein n=1 Tax=Psychrobacter alimentarius TaxID=261164 RepID=UPI003FD5AFFC